ncbi:MAG: lysine--tRNA ligase [Thermoplasmata archaeon]
MHWVDTVAQALVKERPGVEHVVASGTSISGAIHIGNAGDVIMAEGVCRAVRRLGGKARLIWISDDMDPFRKVPMGFPPEFHKYLGFPVSSLPCPKKEHCESFVKHCVDEFMRSLAEIGVRPEIYSGTKMYKEGMYENEAKKALDNADKVRKILKEISGTEKKEDWLPFDPVCSRCGRIATTHSYKYENGKVHYKCIGGVAGKQKIEGCGNVGESDLRSGKLAWRVEWAARWKILGVTCEPFGKEHAAAGGSYDTSKVICEDIFGYKPPHPVIYEHILVGGAKMSKSLGNIITVDDILRVAPPEIMRFFFFRTKATKHKDFDITKDLVKLIEDYEHVERLYYGVDKPSPQEDLEELKRSYELSQIEENRIPERYFQVPFRHMSVVAQITKVYDDRVKILKRTGHVPEHMTPWEEDRLKRKFQAVDNWLAIYATEQDKFSIKEKLEKSIIDSLTDAQKRTVLEIADKLKESNWEAEEIHNIIHNVGTATGLGPKDTFTALYKLLLGKDKGPKLGYFLSILDNKFIIDRLYEVKRSD